MYCQCDDFHQKIFIKSLQDQLRNCWRSLLSWSLIFCKTYKFLCNMRCLMCDAWCVMFQAWFFVRYCLYESSGHQKHPIWVICDLFNDIPKLIQGGSHMYTISCKASYIIFQEWTNIIRCTCGKFTFLFFFRLTF